MNFPVLTLMFLEQANDENESMSIDADFSLNFFKDNILPFYYHACEDPSYYVR